MGHTQQRLVCDLCALGVKSGDTLFIHSSYKSLGRVDQGAITVVNALQEAVGPAGLVLLPSFNLVDRERRAASWDPAITPSTVGWLTEFFRSMPDTWRSDHYSHSVAARGAGAEAFVADHLAREGFRSPWDLAPWGRTYGTHSPMFRAYENGGKLLMLGVDYYTSTYVHLVEVIIWNRRLAADPDRAYQGLDRPALGAYWDGLGRLRRGLVGDSTCRLFGIRDYVDTLVEYVEGNS